MFRIRKNCLLTYRRTSCGPPCRSCSSSRSPVVALSLWGRCPRFTTTVSPSLMSFAAWLRFQVQLISFGWQKTVFRENSSRNFYFIFHFNVNVKLLMQIRKNIHWKVWLLALFPSWNTLLCLFGIFLQKYRMSSFLNAYVYILVQAVRANFVGKYFWNVSES
jgi:hypothetical protein